MPPPLSGQQIRKDGGPVNSFVRAYFYKAPSEEYEKHAAFERRNEGMIWSKLKKLSEELLATSLQGRVRYHLARYGPGVSHHMARGWIAFDGREILTCSTIKQVQEGYRLTGAWYSDDDVTREELHRQGVFTRDEYVEALEECIRAPIEDLLQSASPLTRAIALLDRRVGKRRLQRIILDQNELQVVKDFYQIRCETEGIGIGEKG